MKKIISVNKTAETTNLALLIARVAIATLMLTHGLPKLLMLLSPGPVQFPPLFGLTPGMSLGLAVFAEVFCSIFLLAGFVTRLSVIPLAITMLVAVMSIHQADPFAKKELALIYFVIYVVLFFTGSGKFSVDYLLQRRQLNTVKFNN